MFIYTYVCGCEFMHTCMQAYLSDHNYSDYQCYIPNVGIREGLVQFNVYGIQGHSIGSRERNTLQVNKGIWTG